MVLMQPYRAQKCQAASAVPRSLPYLDPNMPGLEEVDIEGNEEDQVLVLEESTGDFSLPGSHVLDVKDLCNTPASEDIITSDVCKSLPCHTQIFSNPPCPLLVQKHMLSLKRNVFIVHHRAESSHINLYLTGYVHQQVIEPSQKAERPHIQEVFSFVGQSMKVNHVSRPTRVIPYDTTHLHLCTSDLLPEWGSLFSGTNPVILLSRLISL